MLPKKFGTAELPNCRGFGNGRETPILMVVTIFPPFSPFPTITPAGEQAWGGGNFPILRYGDVPRFRVCFSALEFGFLGTFLKRWPT